ncbi:MAG: NUDIX hydrolase [Actinobacteria bacterium]|nr:NUDIX hydrolase [Actinomycetota bacterium]
MDNEIKSDEELYEKLSEKKITSRLVFKGKILKLFFDKVRLPNNLVATREKVSHPGAVAVVPVTEKGEIILVKQYRYPLGKILIEIPAGKLDSSEPPEECAARELHEEAGVIDGKLTELVKIHTSPGFSDEKMYIYLATDFREKNNNPDHDEFLYTFKADIRECIKMINEGVITDAKSIVGILCARDYLAKDGKKYDP